MSKQKRHAYTDRIYFRNLIKILRREFFETSRDLCCFFHLFVFFEGVCLGFLGLFEMELFVMLMVFVWNVEGSEGRLKFNFLEFKFLQIKNVIS